MLLVLIVGPPYSFPNPHHGSPRDVQWAYNYPHHGCRHPSNPDGIMLELIYEPKHYCQQAHAMHSSEDICCKRYKTWLAKSQFCSSLRVMDTAPGEKDKRTGSNPRQKKEPQ